MRPGFWMGLMLLCLTPVCQAQAQESIDDAAASVTTSVAGKSDFHAHMARKLAAIAIHERRDRDDDAAREFLELARQHAGMAKNGEEGE